MAVVSIITNVLLMTAAPGRSTSAAHLLPLGAEALTMAAEAGRRFVINTKRNKKDRQRRPSTTWVTSAQTQTNRLTQLQARTRPKKAGLRRKLRREKSKLGCRVPFPCLQKRSSKISQDTDVFRPSLPSSPSSVIQPKHSITMEMPDNLHRQCGPTEMAFYSRALRRSALLPSHSIPLISCAVATLT